MYVLSYLINPTSGYFLRYDHGAAGCLWLDDAMSTSLASRKRVYVLCYGPKHRRTHAFYFRCMYVSDLKGVMPRVLAQVGCSSYRWFSCAYERTLVGVRFPTFTVQMRLALLLLHTAVTLTTSLFFTVCCLG